VLSVLEKEERIGFTGVDPSGRLTLFSIFDFFQKAAIAHAEDLAVGRVAMAERGMVWVLSRMSVRVDRRPELDEVISIATWANGFERLFAVRDFSITASGGVCVLARSLWLLIDIETRRPLRPSALETTLPRGEGLPVLESPLALGMPSCAKLSGRREIKYSDIDFNGHVNNARYVQWIQDGVDYNALKNASRITAGINYLSEVKPCDEIEIWTAPLDRGNGFAFEGRLAGGTACFRAELGLD
jgi:acyl-ACP thioesterase